MEFWQVGLVLIVALIAYWLGWKFGKRTAIITLDSYDCAARQANITIASDVPQMVCAFGYDATGATPTGAQPPDASACIPATAGPNSIAGVPHENGVTSNIRLVIWSVNRHVESVQCSSTSTSTTTTTVTTTSTATSTTTSTTTTATSTSTSTIPTTTSLATSLPP